MAIKAPSSRVVRAPNSVRCIDNPMGAIGVDGKVIHPLCIGFRVLVLGILKLNKRIVWCVAEEEAVENRAPSAMWINCKR